MRMAEHNDVGLDALDRRAFSLCDLLKLAEYVRDENAPAGDFRNLFFRVASEAVVISLDRDHGSKSREIVYDVELADVAGMNYQLYAIEEFLEGGIEFTVSVGDNADDHGNLGTETMFSQGKYIRRVNEEAEDKNASRSQ